MIIIKEELLGIMLENYPDWNQTPERFLGFITLMDELSEIDGEVNGTEMSCRSEFASRLAELFISILGVNISPYSSFYELRENCILESDLREELNTMVEKMKASDSLEDLVLETGVSPSKETMLRGIAEDFLARSVTERLRPYVDFR